MRVQTQIQRKTYQSRRGSVQHYLLAVGLLILTVGLLSGCGLLAGMLPGAPEEPTPTPTEDRILQPTFTPTVPGADPVETPPADQPAAEEPVAAEPATETSSEEPTEETTELEPITVGDIASEATTDTDTAAESSAETSTEAPAPQAQLSVTSPSNLRNGPGTNYGIAGAAQVGDTFEVVGKNAAGDWWQICCVNGQQAWIFGQLGTVTNSESVAIAQNIPEPPPTPVPAPTAVPAPTQAPAAPAPAEPEPTAPPAEPAPAADPCAGIGGDGCKFEVSAGPAFGDTGGQELKFQLAFIHSGVDGGQAQGSYFVVVEKDGVRLPISDSTRSIALDKRSGPLGEYNYEYSLGASDLPGGNVAGNYTMWVLDGNGERDSQNFSFTVPDGQGLVWMTWDQA